MAHTQSGASFRDLAFLALSLVAAAAAQGQQHPASAKLEFNRDIRPILSDNCFACHGPNKAARQGGLRLDDKSSALTTGAVVPGHPEKSALVARINGSGGPIMPPVTTHKTLNATQKKLLTDWVKQGAPFQPYWAYGPLRRPAVPKITSTSLFTVRSPIDSYILEKLNSKKITPSKEADRRTLIRRLSLDLIGLPPTPREVSAFLADKSPDAYNHLVDRLMMSPHYGERMAVPWLDMARYADTVGFHGDQNMNSWPYRDYVIDSFNKNKPFDKFTIEQLAGDLLPNPTPEQLTATCFNRLNMVTREGGAQDKEYLAKSAADRVRTVGMTFFGSTFACAECHDHKFDPITTRDFYSLGSFFADLKQWGIYADYGYTPNPDLRGYNNDYPFPPEIKVNSAYLQQRIAKQRAAIGEIAAHALLTAAQQDRDRFNAWIGACGTFVKQHPDSWETPIPKVAANGRNSKGEFDEKAARPGFAIQPNGSILLTDSSPGDITLTLKPESPYLASVRVEILPRTENGDTVYRKGLMSARVGIAAAVVHAGDQMVPVAFRFATANFSEPEYNSGHEVANLKGGWRASKENSKSTQVAVWYPDTPIALGETDTVEISLPRIQAGCVRVSLSPFVPERPGVPAITDVLKTALIVMQSGGLKTASLSSIVPSLSAPITQFLEGTAWSPNAFARYKAIEADIFECREGRTPVMVAEARKEPLVTRILARGNWQDESGAIVEPTLPSYLPHETAPKGRRLTRLDLAKWIVSDENPITARAMVNRYWRLFFGTAISAQVEDLGAQGEWPTHPELLDWLATEFRSSGWDMKHMVRLIVTSSTYRQESKLRPELKDIDPANRLLSSQNPRRLEAELVRDNALTIAGMLNSDLGGPPCFPYQPAGYYANIQFPDRDWIASGDDRQYRRGLYMHWQRTFLHPMLANFDAPSREDCTATRTNANTPQQALTLLNDPEFTEAARVLGTELATKNISDAVRVETLFQRALCRSPRANEQASLLTFLKQMRTAYHERPADAAAFLHIGNAPAPSTSVSNEELAAWANVCRVVLNLHETIVRY